MSESLLEDLYRQSDRLLKQVRDSFTRYLLPHIPWQDRMIAITGARGTGKTTLMLQHMRFGLPNAHALYVSADHPWFYSGTLLEMAEAFDRNGGTHLFLDEVHKYPGWSRELKTIYDGFPGMRIVFSASSALDIYRGEADLSRRVVTYCLAGLSFREYLQFHHKISLPIVPFNDLADGHREYVLTLPEGFHPLPYFRSYLKEGYYPFSKESSQIGYFMKLVQVINATIESDLAVAEDFHPGGVVRLKRLLGVLSSSTPFTPNISKISAQLGLSRETVYQYLSYLERARLLNFLMKPGRGDSVLQKPDKLFLENTNLAHALTPNPDPGTIRETFLMNQLKNVLNDVRLPETRNFIAGNYTLEVGGRSKKAGQIKAAEIPLIVQDDIETGVGNTIPLWLFGMMY